MDVFTLGCIGAGVLFILLAIGVHIAIALGVVGTIGIVMIMGLKAGVEYVTVSVFFSIFRFELIVLPLFIMAGLLSAQGGISKDIYQCLSLWFNRLRAGLGISTVFSCAAFGTICGSSLVTASVFAKVSAPEMRRLGYEKRFTYGLIAASGNIGMLIPPSILIVYYAIITEESVGKLLIAGTSPGLLCVFAFSIGIWVMSSINPSLVGNQPMLSVTWLERITALRLLWPVFLISLILVGGIIFGVFDPNEAGAFAVVILLIINIIRKRSFKLLAPVFRETAATVAMIFLILAGAITFARFLMLTGIAQMVIEYIISLKLSASGLIIVMAILYLILGCFLDSISMLSITIPIIYPVVRTMGIDPIWFGIAIIFSIEMGTITPPVGLNVYAVKAVAESDVTLEDIFAGMFPFFLMMLMVQILLIAFPLLSTFLPSFMD